MFKSVCAVVFSVAVAGCATTGSIQKNLQTKYVGQPIGVAIDDLGFPAGDRWVAGRHVYTWTTGRTLPDLTTLSNGQTVMRGSSSYSCTLDLEVNDTNKVINFNFSGQMAACAAFDG